MVQTKIFQEEFSSSSFLKGFFNIISYDGETLKSFSSLDWRFNLVLKYSDNRRAN